MMVLERKGVTLPPLITAECSSPAVAGSPGATVDVRNGVLRCFRGSQLVSAASRSFSPGTGALVFVETCVDRVVAAHHGESLGRDVSIESRSQKGSCPICTPRSGKRNIAYARFGSEVSAEKDDTVGGATGRVGCSNRATLLHVADFAVLKDRSGAAEYVIRIPLDIAVAEILRSRVNVQRILIAYESTVEELLALPCGPKRHGL